VKRITHFAEERGMNDPWYLRSERDGWGGEW